MDPKQPLVQEQPSKQQGQQIFQEEYQQHSPESLSSHPTLSSAMKTYSMYYTTSMSNVRLHLGSSSDPCIYYMESSLLTTKPQMQLRFGNSKSSPMVSFAKIHLTSRQIQLGSGDYKKDPEGQLVWEEMRREKSRVKRSNYEFGSSIEGGPRRQYTWKLENHSIVKTMYQCVNDNGQVVAKMLSGGMLNWSKGGEIEIAEGLEKKLEELLIISALALWVAEAGWSVLKGYGSVQGGAGGASAKDPLDANDALEPLSQDQLDHK